MMVSFPAMTRGMNSNIGRRKLLEGCMRLENKVALITGGAAGIGKATVTRFIEEGAFVSFCDVDEQKGRALADQLGERASFTKVDVSDYDATQQWAKAVADKQGQIDILVNNAGILRDGQLVKVKNNELVSKMSEADFDLVISINLKGVFNCTQAVAPIMIRAGGGVILNATSVVGEDGNFGQTNYVATKAGVIGMTKVWTRELGKYGIRVNAVAPGFTATEILSSMPEKIIEAMKARTPLRRMGETVDIANAYLFLASDEARFITGTVLRVDGGIVVGT